MYTRDGRAAPDTAAIVAGEEGAFHVILRMVFRHEKYGVHISKCGGGILCGYLSTEYLYSHNSGSDTCQESIVHPAVRPHR